MRSEAIGFVRQSADNPRVLEGLAVPYGVISRPTELYPGTGTIVREAWAPGSFSADVSNWNLRADGRKAPFRPRHNERPVAAVIAWTDTPQGVAFRTGELFKTPEADAYLAEVNAGLNGVSVEGMWNDPPRVARDGTVIHKSGKLHGLAGSDNPAFDGAHVALRDMEEAMGTNETPEPQPEPQPEPPKEPEQAQRSAATTKAEAVAPAQRAAAEQATAEAISPAHVSQMINRDALVYGRDAVRRPNGQTASFLSDGWAAMQGDSDARERQYRYRQATDDLMRTWERDAATALRAGDVLSSELGGAFPNEYLPGLFEPRILKGRPMGGFYSRFPISDGNPKIYPRTTTSTTVAVQSAEGVNPAASDFATTATTVTPLIYGAETVVSRQALDGSNPAAEAMIMEDMMEAYAQASETVIKTAVEAGSTASGSAITAATPFAGTLQNLLAYATARFKPAEGQFVPPALFAVLAGQLSAGDGRPLLPTTNPTNTDGQLTGPLGYELIGARGAMSYANTVNVVVTGRRADFVIFESPIARFSYDAVTGPAGVRIGIWAYLVVGVRAIGGSLKVTAA